MLGSIHAAELEQEAKSTRKMLERVPAEKLSWKPHEKSMSLMQLAVHVAEIPSWTRPSITQPELDFATFDYTPPTVTSADDLVAIFDKNVADAIAVLQEAPDAAFGESWTMRNGETVYFTMPKAAVMRGFVMSHFIHHRGQLSVYLRLLDVPIPSIYGPSADEGQM
jgi:uncharacterized damage-inducible protein DinB